MLFNENTFKDTHTLFKNMGLHHGEMMPAKKQEMLVSISTVFLEAIDKLHSGIRADMVSYEQGRTTNDKALQLLFQKHIAFTFEDKLAYAMLLCYDFAGCWRLKSALIEKGYNNEAGSKELMQEINKGMKSTSHDMMEAYNKEFNDNVEKKIPYPKAYALCILKCIVDTYYGGFGSSDMGVVLARLHMLAIEKEVDIQKFIDLRIKYLV